MELKVEVKMDNTLCDYAFFHFSPYLHPFHNIKGTSINCPEGANFQYPRTNSVGYIKQIHHSVLKARALKNELIESTLIEHTYKLLKGSKNGS